MTIKQYLKSLPFKEPEEKEKPNLTLEVQPPYQKCFYVNFSNIAKDQLLRINPKTLKLKTEIDGKIGDFIKLYDIFHILSGFAFKSEDYEEDGTPLIRISNVDNEKADLVHLPEEFSEDYAKYLLKQGDIIIGLTGEGKIKVGLIEKNLPMLLNQRVGALRIYNSRYNNIFLYYCLKCSKFVSSQFLYFSNGKTQLNISPTDLLKIKIPNISKSIQDEIVKKIEPLEEEIKALKKQIIDEKLIINEVFAREFGFDIAKFEELKKEKMFYRDFFNFSQNVDLRFSAKFHRTSAKFVYDELAKITDKKIKDYIEEPIVLGSSISPENYDEMGDHYYVSMADIKTWNVNVESCKAVSKAYFQENKNKLVKTGDLIIARSGEGTIGKIAMIENDDFEGVFADFTMRVRLANYNNLFAYFYFRTEYFQYLIEINKKGLGNNTNIFPVQIREFPIPNISLERQERIAGEIKERIESGNVIHNSITARRNKIDEIINETLKI